MKKVEKKESERTKSERIKLIIMVKKLERCGKEESVRENWYRWMDERRENVENGKERKWKRSS